MSGKWSTRGFTLLEIVIVVAVIAVLSVVGLVGYQKYVERARSADILVKYDAIRAGVGADIAQGSIGKCSDVVQRLGDANLAGDYARLSYGFEAVAGGYRPVLTVCAKADQHGSVGVAVVREAHDILAKNGRMEKGAVLTQTVASFSAPLTDTGKSVCTTPYGSVLTACGDPIAVPPMPVINVPTAPTPKAMVAPPVQAIAVPKIQATVMRFSGSDTFVRPAGKVLNTNGDISAFTLDMSFIGDGSVPAASGGRGPVMFNYGDATNSHNAISLWNPRSLTVAIAGRDYDTHVNVVDGSTHRVTVAWDGASGVLVVYDNGVAVQTFTGVATGQKLAGGGSMVIAHKDNAGSYMPEEAFAGQVFHTAFANIAVSAAQAARPLNQALDKNPALLADFRAQGTSIVDTTGRHTVETGGVTTVTTGVEGNLVTPGGR